MSEGQFRRPWGIACDGIRKVYVADGNIVWNSSQLMLGLFLAVFGSCGLGDRQLVDNGIFAALMTWYIVGEAYKSCVYMIDGQGIRKRPVP